MDNTRKLPQFSLLPFCSPSPWDQGSAAFSFLKQQEDPSPRIPPPGEQPASSYMSRRATSPPRGNLSSASHRSSDARQESSSSGWYSTALSTRPHFLSLKSLYLLPPHFPNSAANKAGTLQTIALVPHHLN